MEIVDNMNISIKAEIQNENLENYKCPVCNLVEFSAKNQLIQHMTGNALGIWFCGFRFFPKRTFLAPPPCGGGHASALCKTKDYIAVQRASIGTDARFINFM